MKHNLYSILSVLLLLVVWYAYALFIDNVFILPKPTQVFIELFDLLRNISTYTIILSSFQRLFIAITIASTLGIIFGLLAGGYRRIAAFLHPLVTTLRSLPVASIIVILLILSRDRTSAIYTITFLMIFPIIFESTKQGVLNIDTSIKQALDLEPHRRIKILRYIYLPLAFPYIKTGFLQSIGLGFKVLVMAEFIAQTDNSIGKTLYISSTSIYYETVFAWTIIIIVIVLMIERLIKKLRSH